MRRWIIIVLIVAIIGLSSSVAISFAHNSQNIVSPKSLSQNSISDSDMQYFYYKIKDFGIELKKTDETPKLTEEMAIEIAKKSVGERISKEAESITAMYVKFTNRPEGIDGPALVLPGTNVVLEDIPVWIVTFHRVNVPRQGPGNADIGNMNIVIDANSGEELEGFSYNIPIKH